ncbi:GtrA family protein [Piscinibacter terrae]|uniref:GtrA family protein n=1 Tax=Piscinibacter terrae TaxID=2496871 RepID=A0A3N7JU50_9BURK|nr:GtrA family protein [Albitalea terrae]RQP24459.1 GtrA family protein [Albitalea terrae]
MQRFVRYALVGAIATAAHYALLAVVVEWLHWPAWLGSGLGAVLGAQVAFFGNRVFTFGHEGPIVPAWLKFMGTAAAGALLGMLIVAVSVQWGLHYLVGQVMATLASLVLTFLINRAWTFRHPEGRAP